MLKILSHYRVLPDNDYVSYVELQTTSLMISNESCRNYEGNLLKRFVDSYDINTKEKMHVLKYLDAILSILQ